MYGAVNDADDDDNENVAFRDRLFTEAVVDQIGEHKVHGRYSCRKLYYSRGMLAEC